MRKVLLIGIAVVGLLTSVAATDVRSMVLETSADTYVVVNLVRPANPVMDENFGQLDFVRLWYNTLAPEDAQLLSVGLLKFDLEPLKDLEVESASLQVYALRIDLAEAARLVDVALVRDDWSEPNVTYTTRPAYGSTPLATVTVFGPNQWYSWDVTRAVTGAIARSTESPSISFVLGMRRSSQKGLEEQVVFTSREAGQNAPRLLVTFEKDSSAAWWPWAIGIAGAALLAFGFGVWVAQRRRSATAAPGGDTGNTP